MRQLGLSANRIQPECAATSQNNGVDFLHHAGGGEQIGLACGGGAAAHIHRADGGALTQDDGAASGRLGLRVMADLDARDIADIIVSLHLL